MMAKLRTTILLVGLVALCAVSIASPLGKVSDYSSEELDRMIKIRKELAEMNNSGSDAVLLYLIESYQEPLPLSKVADSPSDKTGEKMNEIADVGKNDNGSDAALLYLVSSLQGSSPSRKGSSSEELDNTDEMMKKLAEMCKNNSGSDAAFLNLMESFQSAMECASSAIDLDNFWLEANKPMDEIRSTFFPRYCPQLRTANPCIDKFVTGFRPCLEADDYVIVRGLASMLPDAIELICKNDGEIFYKIDEPKIAECFDKMPDFYVECFSFLNVTDTDDWNISHLTRDQCGQLNGFRECVKRKVDICKAPDLISVYDLFHNTLLRMTPCRNYVEIEKVVQVIDNNDIQAV